MNKSMILSFLCIITYITNFAQSKKSMDIESIKSMCGCFKIDFNFAETFVFSEDEDYKNFVKNEFTNTRKSILAAYDPFNGRGLLIPGEGGPNFIMPSLNVKCFFGK